jgi:hypothetical protein
MVVVAEGPRRDSEWWAGIIQRATRDIDGMLESICFGMGFSTQDHRLFAVSLLFVPSFQLGS